MEKKKKSDKNCCECEEQKTELFNKVAEEEDIPIEKIEVGKFCRRSSYEDIEPLAESIKQVGLLHAGTAVRKGDGSYTLLCGSRRLEALKLLGKKTFRCHVIEASKEQEAILSYVDNETTALKPVDRARKIRLMMETFGWTETEIAEKIGLNQNTISEYVGMLDLDESILEQIDNRSESSFKYTHAMVLSKLFRSNRFNAKIEVQQLFNKTIKCRLLCSELKALVQIFKTGGYDRLPDQLRTFLLQDDSMTSAMAMLYLEPESIIEGNDETASRRRQLLQNLDRTLLKDTISKAVKANWSYERTKQRLIDLIEQKSASTGQKKSEAKLSHQKLRDDISNIYGKLDVCCSEFPHIAESDPDGLRRLCEEVENIRDKFEKFIVLARTALDKRELKQSA